MPTEADPGAFTGAAASSVSVVTARFADQADIARARDALLNAGVPAECIATVVVDGATLLTATTEGPVEQATAIEVLQGAGALTVQLATG